MTDRLTIGISTCPNDTFAFHALLTGAVRCPGVELEFRLGDVEELNVALAGGELDVSKGSFALAVARSNELVVLESGTALGFGVGPVLLAAQDAPPLGPDARLLAPGRWTTANLLLRLLHPGAPAARQVVFSEIMPALRRGEADYGVCIHEGRFTYADAGLRLVEDLGASWEARTRSPLPLGGILARRSVGEERLAALSAAIGASIDWARAHPGDALRTMRRHAQEQDDEVLWKHVELYVNDWTRALGETGNAALRALSDAARTAGLLDDAPDLEVISADHAGERCFHLVRPSAWFDRPTAEWRPPSLDSEGFLHASTAAQLAGTLAAHYADDEELLLVELDRTRTASALRFEASRGGALFPHLYRALQPEDLARWWTIRSSRGRWDLPNLAAEAAGDDPVGTPGAPPDQRP